jgi:hypothetical protein
MGGWQDGPLAEEARFHDRGIKPGGFLRPVGRLPASSFRRNESPHQSELFINDKDLTFPTQTDVGTDVWLGSLPSPFISHVRAIKIVNMRAEACIILPGKAVVRGGEETAD